ncbi:MAG: PKD domain-containing protein [Bacteroidota bacterium]
MANRKFTFYLFFLSAFLLLHQRSYAQQDIVAYAGNTGAERFNTVLQLSDGTYLVGGSATDLNWINNGSGGPGIQQIQLGRGNIKNDRSKKQKIGFILHISTDLKTIIRVLYFNKGDVEDVRHIKTNSVPGSATGDIFISGNIEYVERNQSGSNPARNNGYYVAKLNNNFLGGTPNGLSWSFNVWATGMHKSRQPWDVGKDGKVVYVRGEANGTDFCAIYRRKSDGTGNDIVADWTTHNGTNILDGSASNGEWTPAFSNAQVKTYESLVNLKLGACSLRSWNAADYTEVYNDENGTTKRGRWPLDYFFNSACNVTFPGASQAMPGYTGYQSGATSTAYVGGIAVDKQTNEMYFGASFQSITSVGQPDVEPFIIAYTASGAKKWWARLYQETPAQSPPDQYVDALTIDYSGSQKAVLAVGRQHGNAIESMWAGNTIANNPLLPFGTATFSQQYTGTNTNMHLSWLGKYRAASGDLLYSTYVAGFYGSSAGIDASSVGTVTEALAFPSHNKSWPDLSDTRAEIDMKIDDSGRIYMLLRSRGFTTTNRAYQKQESPVPNLLASNRRDITGDYVVVYEPDLKKLVYSSLLSGEWNRSETDASRGSIGGGNTDLLGLFPWNGGVTVVGYHQDLNGDAIPDGSSIPFHYQYGSPYPNLTFPAFTPTWGKNTLQNDDGETAILARLTFTKTVRADFKVMPTGGTCTNTAVNFTDLSFADAGIKEWAWNFGAGATPATATTQNPVVQWTTIGEKTISLTVKDNNNVTDTRTITYFVDAAPSAAFTLTGSTGPAPASITFNGPAGAGLSYLWEITDPTTNTVTTYSVPNPDHLFLVGGSPGTDYPVKLTVSKGACTQTSTQTIRITAGPGPLKPNFTVNNSATPSAVCIGQIITFQQVNTANATSWLWSFGEGATPASATTVGPHKVVYITPGPKSATVTVGNSTNTATYAVNFGVAAAPTASFKYTINTPNAPAQINFVADEPSANSYQWDFGNPNGSGSKTATGRTTNNRAFNEPGEFTVSLTVTSTNGCKTTYYETIVIGSASNPGFQSNFSFGPASGACINNKVSIREMATGGQNASNSTFSWNFGLDSKIPGSNSTPATSSSYKPPLIYWTTPGKKVITLTINDGGQIRVKSQVYEVFPYPIADFTVDVANSSCAASPFEVAFAAAAASGNLYEWTFGAAATPTASNSANPKVQYVAGGTYPVQLTSLNNGCRSVSVKNVIVGTGTCGVASLSAGISLQPSRAGCASNEYIVQSISSGNIANPAGYTWTFPGNASVPRNDKGPKTLILTSGDVITLVVKDVSNNTDSISITVP